MSKFKVSLIIYIIVIVIVGGLTFSDDVELAIYFCAIISFLYALFLFAMSMMIRKNFYLNAINQNSNGSAILTFDDGPHPQETLKVLDILDTYKIKAMFFMIGKNVAKYPEMAKEVYDRGHQIGIHSQNHKWNFGFLVGQSLNKEIADCQDEIEKVTGEKPLFFRPPFGVTNPSVAAITRKLNLKTVGWNLRTFDTVAKKSGKIVNLVLEKLTPNNIILLHDRMFLTTQALPQLIEKAMEKGIVFGMLTNEHEKKD